MDTKFKEILDGLPDKPPRSRLEPYRELIRKLRRRSRTYHDIAQLLAEKCQVQVTASGVHDFVRRRTEAKRTQSVRTTSRRKRKTVSAKPRIITLNSALKRSSRDEVQGKIAGLKARKPASKPIAEKFQFDPSEPLRLTKPGRKTSG